MSEKIKSQENEGEGINICKRVKLDELGIQNIISEIIVQMQNVSQSGQFALYPFLKGKTHSE